MMGVGLSGVLGNGKRELARLYAKDTGFELLTFDSEELFKRTRAKFTNKGVIGEYRNVLSILESYYNRATPRFVTDVTPIDVLAELYSCFTWFNDPGSELDKEVALAYQDACRICSQNLAVIMLIQPLTATVRVENLNAIGSGLIHTRLVNDITTSMFSVSRSIVDQQRRLKALKGFVFENCSANTPYSELSSAQH